jgi:predicted anti-sigma-YlaC factor YlaD
MNCADFQHYLPQMLAEVLEPSQLLLVEQHLASCPQCLVLWTDALADGQALSVQPSLASNVLNTLGLNPCIAAQDALCEHKDPTLQLDTTVALHLEGCPDCAALSQTVLELNRELPTLCEIPVPEKFTLQVLARTSRQVQMPTEFTNIKRKSWRSMAKRVSQRPRFAIEAAYVLSLSLLFVISTPTLGLDRRDDVDQIIYSARSLGELQSQIIREQNDLILRSGREQWDKLYDTTFTQITVNTQRTQEWINAQATQLMRTVESAQETLFSSENQQQNI